MAVKPANSRYHTFTFNGVRAADYGIYVTDVNVFNSAARDVEYIEIPGRDGAFALDRGRFQNISVVYKCAMTQDTDEDFATAISEFRNAIASTKGYKRLEDDIHTDEYRMGVFSKGLEAPTLNTKTATFEVTFDCKPQRFLKSGEIPRTIGGAVTNPQTKSGSIVSIESDGGDKVTSLVAQITPVQAGSGDPSPTNVRPITGWTAVNVIVSPTTTASDGTTTITALSRTVYGGTLDVVTGVLTVTWVAARIGALAWGYNSNGNYFYTSSVSKAAGSFNILSDIFATATVDDVTRMGDYHIKGSAANNNLFVTDSRYTTVADFKSANDQRYIYVEAATPQTYQLTAQQVELLTGQNHVWADTGDTTLTYGRDPNKIVNPTLFESHPLLQVWGYGDIGINDDTINIADDVIGDVTLWERPSTQWDHKGGITYSQSNLRSGDRITVSKGSRALIELDFPQGDIVNHVSHTVTGGDADKFSQIVDIRRESAAYIDVYYNVLTFLASSNSSETATIEVTIEHTPSGGSATVSTINCEFIITNQQISAEQHTYKMWISGKPTGNYSSVIREYKYGYRIERMTAYSTKSALGEPLYFDLDIGEAYKIEDGQTISVNNAVSFPARLPVLKSGTNTITYENTVDQLKIVPRWWEV